MYRLKSPLTGNLKTARMKIVFQTEFLYRPFCENPVSHTEIERSFTGMPIFRQENQSNFVNRNGIRFEKIFFYDMILLDFCMRLR